MGADTRSFFDRLADTFSAEGPLDDTRLAREIEITVPKANREARARDFHESLKAKIVRREQEIHIPR